jgi:hypothetical protein
MRIEVRTLIAVTIMVLIATSSAFARKASQHHSKRPAPNHQSTNNTDPGRVARDPADVAHDDPTDARGDNRLPSRVIGVGSGAGLR